jgi:predicted RNase H-like HicB family nuclease
MTKVNLEMQLPISFLREGDNFIAYTPALDISTCGDTIEDAQKKFTELVHVFFEELIADGTLDETLLNSGWQKKELQWIPPIVVGQTLQTIKI